jgi:adenosylmethionine-8-amino-7-oxononanoate aminotransferase
VLLIVDEVICGFGRSGRKFGHQNFNVQPDIITMAKGITSAYLPLSATAVRADIAATFLESGVNQHFRHVNTFGGTPTACAVALRNMELMEEEGLIQRAAELGALLETELRPIADDPHVGDLRHFGFLAGIELVENRESHKPLRLEKVNQVIAECKKRGVIIGKNGDTTPGFQNVLTLSPPFVTTEEEVVMIVRVLQEALQTLHSQSTPQSQS